MIHVFPLYGDTVASSLTDYECYSLVLPHGEPTKSFQSLPNIYEALLNAKLTRSDLVIALGGGVIGDLAGFAASSYLRGIKFIQIPTSLLAQVDSSVGGKVAVDLPQGKNLVGAFFQPKLVLIDPEVLDTLPEHFIKDGMGEVIKYGCIKDTGLFNLLCSHTSFIELKSELTDVITRCVDIKRIVVEADQFGHRRTDAPELRAYAGPHDRAVLSLWTRKPRRSSRNRHVSDHKDRGRERPYRSGMCRTDPPGPGDIRTSHFMRSPGERSDRCDCAGQKKSHGHLNIVLLKEIGNSYVHPTDLAFFNKTGTIVTTPFPFYSFKSASAPASRDTLSPQLPGVHRIVTPTAFWIALIIAGDGVLITISPIDLAPNGPVAS